MILIFLHKLPKFLRVFFNDFLKISIGIGYLSSKDSPELVMKKNQIKILIIHQIKNLIS